MLTTNGTVIEIDAAQYSHTDAIRLACGTTRPQDKGLAMQVSLTICQRLLGNESTRESAHVRAEAMLQVAEGTSGRLTPRPPTTGRHSASQVSC